MGLRAPRNNKKKGKKGLKTQNLRIGLNSFLGRKVITGPKIGLNASF